MNEIDILHYWFGEPADGWPQERKRLWFAGHADDDRDLQARFGETIARALAGDLRHWCDSRPGLIAYILLLDQMTRATRRGTAAAFAGDAQALAACRDGLTAGVDQQLPAAQRMFFYLPLEHSENLADQEQSVALYDALRVQFPAHREPLDGAFEYVVKHRDLIRRFGRFPHRNALLGRDSTAAEEAFLRAGGPRFGQEKPTR